MSAAIQAIRDAVKAFEKEMKSPEWDLARNRLDMTCSPKAVAGLLSEHDAALVDAERYRWLAHETLVCDYGDNATEGKQIGWMVKKPRGCIESTIFGDSIDQAIDAQIAEHGSPSVSSAINAARAAKGGAA